MARMMVRSAEFRFGRRFAAVIFDEEDKSCQSDQGEAETYDKDRIEGAGQQTEQQERDQWSEHRAGAVERTVEAERGRQVGGRFRA
jgi:hypothetical protein